MQDALPAKLPPNSERLMPTPALAATLSNTLLDDLIRRDILVKTSIQKRGPGVEYGPGAKFPRRVIRSAGRHRTSEAKPTLWGEDLS